jgi:subtilase family serine protease
MVNRQSSSRFIFESLEKRAMLAVIQGSFYESHDILANTSIENANTPAIIQKAYGLNQSMDGIIGDGSGQTVAITAFGVSDPATLIKDVEVFSKKYSIPTANIRIVNSTGASVYPANNKIGALAAAANIEWVHALAPGAKILVVVANSPTSGEMLKANNYAKLQPGVSVILHTWSVPEMAVESTLDKQYFAGSAGITYVSAGRDNGGLGVVTSYPAISPNVLSVGRTILSHAADGTWLGESASPGSAGGDSLNGWEPKPTYQSKLPKIGWNGRQMPDVSADAAPSSGFAVYVTAGGNSGWNAVSGSGQSAAIWASSIAIINQMRVWRGSLPIDGPTQLLPELYNSATSVSLRDITTGSNGSAKAVRGYDMATGLGSITGQFIKRMTDVSPNKRAPVTTLFSTGAQTKTISGTTGSLTATGSADTHYQLISSPYSSTPQPAFVTYTGTYPFTGKFGVWTANDSQSEWISAYADQNSLGGAPNSAIGTYVYQTSFSLNGFDPATAQVSGKLYSDNNLASVYLNGVKSNISAGGFGGSDFVLNSGFQAGINTLTFYVDNVPGAAANPSGFRANIGGTAVVIGAAVKSAAIQSISQSVNLVSFSNTVNAGIDYAAATSQDVKLADKQSPINSNDKFTLEKVVGVKDDFLDIVILSQYQSNVIPEIYSILKNRDQKLRSQIFANTLDWSTVD